MEEIIKILDECDSITQIAIRIEKHRKQAEKNKI